MTDRELMQQALDALNCAVPFGWSQNSVEKHRIASEALRTRLAQPEQEPVAWGVDEGEGKCIDLHDVYFIPADAEYMAELKGPHTKVIPLYTTSSQREWQGLTDEEIREAWFTGEPYDKCARILEAKLKEKNT